MEILDNDQHVTNRETRKRYSENLREPLRLLTERFTEPPAWVVLTQLFIGLGWLRAVAEKVIDPGWWQGLIIEDFVRSHSELTLAWYQPFLDHVVLPLAPLVAAVVVLTQLVAAVSLVSGRWLTVGLTAGMFLNLQFIAGGAVAPSAFYLLAQGALVLWLCERPEIERPADSLRLAAAVAVFIAHFNVPFIATLDPAHVIDDPAVMLVFGGGLAALACLLAARPEPMTVERVADRRGAAIHARQQRNLGI